MGQRQVLTDESIMPAWSKHKGKKLANVPADYLVWLYENDKCYPALKEYIESNLETLKLEVAQMKKGKQK